MPATQTRSISPRQQSYIAALAAERTPTGAIAMAVELAAEGRVDARGASNLIEALLALPRNASNRNRTNTEDVPAPVHGNRAGRMLAAGGIEATVTRPDGEHVTIRINTRRPVGRGWANCSPTDEGARTNIKVLGRKVGWVNVDERGQWNATLLGRVEIKDAVRVLFAYCAGRTDAKGQMGAYRVQEASRCGRCLRTLTDPVSIDRGIGPECYGNDTGSRHAAVGTVEPTPTPRDERYAPQAGGNLALANAAAANERLQAQLQAHAAAAPTHSLTDLAAAAERPALDADKQRARDLIAEALDAQCSDEDRDFAMRVFDRLAR